MPENLTVPLMSVPDPKGNRRKLEEISVEFAQQFPSVYELVRNRRKNVVRVLMKARHMPLSPFSAAGKAYEQKLSTGHVVWALKGRTAEDRAMDMAIA